VAVMVAPVGVVSPALIDIIIPGIRVVDCLIIVEVFQFLQVYPKQNYPVVVVLGAYQHYLYLTEHYLAHFWMSFCLMNYFWEHIYFLKPVVYFLTVEIADCRAMGLTIVPPVLVILLI
jgi:hypothetical protein